MRSAAVIVAAGRGRRAGGGMPKQFRELAGMPVLAHSLLAFLDHPRIGPLALVLHPDDRALFETRVRPHLGGRAPLLAEGGATRAQSVLNGLEALVAEAPARVLIHDGARPLVSAALIGRVIDALGTHPGAAPALALADTLWQGAEGRVAAIRDRRDLYRAQTPQGFGFAAILEAHRQGTAEATDDVGTARAAGIEVAIVEGEADNIKITTAGDFARAERLKGLQMDIRLGNGFDVHAFAPGDRVTLCGIDIPHRCGLAGHSDADVAMHALCDALYGALGAGDIGRWFPPDQAQWKGAESRLFLEHAVALAGERGWSVGNADVTIICEQPKIAPHAAAMAAQLARIMGIAEERVSVKATTSEGLGFTGRGEGIAALATATLRRP